MEGGSVISKLLHKHKSLIIINQLMVYGSLLIAGADASQTGEWNQDGDIVEIPAYVIVSEPELPKPESWHHAMVDEFEVLCSGSVEDANRLLARFQMFRQALDIVRPVDDPGYAFSSIILCGKRRQFEQLVPNPDSTDQEHSQTEQSEDDTDEFCGRLFPHFLSLQVEGSPEFHSGVKPLPGKSQLEVDFSKNARVQFLRQKVME